MVIQRIYRVVSGYFRRKRMGEFWERFGLEPSTRVLDVGGNQYNWLLLKTWPRLTIVNLDLNYGSQQQFIRVAGDGRRLPFRDGAYDVVFSNSVIEHLGSWEDQQLFANECRRVAGRYYVQTPNRNFFIDTHQITPFIHWLPRKIQLRLMRNFTVRGILTRPTRQECESLLDEIRLLNKREMRELFPDAEIWEERFLGMTKSLIAARRSPIEPAGDPRADDGPA